jgi:amino acid transporter
LFFEPLARVHPKHQTPHVSVLLSGVLGISYVLVATAMTGSKAFGSLTDAFVIGMVPFYALSVGSVFVFRRREKKRLASQPEPELEDSLVDPLEPGHPEVHRHDYSPPVHTPLFPVPPLLFIGSTLILLVNSLLDESSRGPTIVTLGIVVFGLPLYFATVARRADREPD